VAAVRSPLARRLVALAGGTLLTAGVLVAAGSASPAAAAPGSGPAAVVALGDSAISGEGAGAYEPGTNGPGGDFCHRSTRALIQRTAIPGIAARISLACSGAASSDVRINGTTHYTEPSQADRLRAVARDNDVKMVVLQIGANDDPQFADTVLSCVRAWANPFGPACSVAPASQWPARVAAMAPKVEAVVNDVRTVMRETGYADSAYQFVLQSYASPFTENMNSITHAFEGCPIRIADARFSRTQAVGQLSAALRGVGPADRRAVPRPGPGHRGPRGLQPVDVRPLDYAADRGREHAAALGRPEPHRAAVVPPQRHRPRAARPLPHRVLR
jgi:lysophospholipase L1-like esterase